MYAKQKYQKDQQKNKEKVNDLRYEYVILDFYKEKKKTINVYEKNYYKSIIFYTLAMTDNYATEIYNKIIGF